MTPPNNITNAELYKLLSDISGNIGEINGKLDGLVSTQTKTIYALIALAGATVGLKLMGSPPLWVISGYINLFVFIFATVLSIHKRDTIYGWGYILAFGLLGIVANIYKLMPNAMDWIRTSIFILANSSLVMFLWNWDRWRKDEPTSR